MFKIIIISLINLNGIGNKYYLYFVTEKGQSWPKSINSFSLESF